MPDNGLPPAAGRPDRDTDSTECQVGAPEAGGTLPNVEHPLPMSKKTGSMTSTGKTIASARALLAPLEPSEFIAHHLERELLHLERRDPSLVDGIFDLDSMGHCLRYMQPQRRNLIRVVAGDRSGERTTEMLARIAEAPGSGERLIRSLFADGHTVVFRYAEGYWPALESIAMDLRRVLRSLVHCNVYCTPPDSQIFDTHVDTHDFLILQTSGSKTWRLHAVPHELPIDTSPLLSDLEPRLPSALPTFGPVSREIVLRPGDLLYLPRGVPHSVASTDQHSVHVTIGLYPLRMHQLLSRVLDLLAMQAVELRRGTPIEWFDGEGSTPSAGDLLRQAAQLADAAESPIDLDRILQVFEEQHAPPIDPRGSIVAALRSKHLDLDTVLERPAGATWKTRRGPGEFRVSCGKGMALPLKLEPVLGFFERHERFRVGDLPEMLSDNAKLTLARSLVKNELLRVSDQPAPPISDIVTPTRLDPSATFPPLR